MSRRRFFWPALVAVTAFFTVVGGTIALADNVIADGDGLAPLTSNGVAFGNVCKTANPHPQKTVLLAINKVGGGNNVYANSAPVAVSATSVSGSGLSATGGGTITLVSNWTSLVNNTQSSSVSSTVTLDPSSLPAGAYLGSITYSAVGAKDGGGTLTRTATVNVTATIQDCNTPPTLNLPADITTEAQGASGAVVNYTVTASDTQDDPDPTPSCSPASGSTFSLGTTTVNCSVTDSAGATTTGSFKIIVRDTTGPVLSLADQTVEATGSSGAAVTFNPSASDLVDGSVAVICDANSGDTFPIGSTLVTCSAMDNAENTTNGSFTITVVDTTPPTLTLPADIGGVEATGPGGVVVNFPATASDLVDGSVAVTCVPASGSTFPVGTTTVNCSATDAHHNTATGSFKVTVQDTTPPTVTVPGDITAEATSSSGAVVTFSASASDAVSGSITPVCTPASGSTFALGTTTVTCSATDGAGNTGSASFDVTVQDTTPPTVTVPANMTEEATSSSGAVVTFSASASDAVSGSITPVCTPASGSTFALGTTTVTCSATDGAGNTGSNSFMVHVVDTKPPTIDAHADVTVTATSSSGAVVNYTSPATHDAVDGDGLATCTPASGSTFAIGNTIVTCNATDAAGNHATTTFVVHVVYNWTGFFQPVDNNGVFNTVKAGSAIPIKFNLGGNQGLNIFKAGYPQSARVPCNATAPTDLIEQTVTAGGSSLTYDTAAQQYVYVWKTDKAWAGTCRVFDLGLNDGTSHTAYFNFTK